MSRFPIRFAKARRSDSRSKLFTWMLMFAFLLQSCITQIHIHGASQAATGSTIVKVVSQPPAGGKTTGDNPADCPFCQAIVHAGAFFAPAPPLLLLPAWQVENVAPIVSASVTAVLPAHNWQSRAPPRR
jgi:hypothetical protein